MIYEVNETVPPKEQTLQQLLRPLMSLLNDPEITEITFNQPEEIWSRTRSTWTCHNRPDLTLSYLHALATALMVYNGLPPKSIAAVLLPDGQRGHIVLPPACLDGTLSLSIRKHIPTVKSLADLDHDGAFTTVQDVSFNQPTFEEAQHLLSRSDFTRLQPFEVTLLDLKRQGQFYTFLEQAVLTKRNIIVAGKTGSGKTTFARSLIEKVPVTERLITLEDVHELILCHHPNRVHMLYGQSDGRIRAEEGLASCLRQSPDRIFLAELRGNEAWEYLNSLNTGHPGSITTTHANNALQTFERLATLIKTSDVGRQLDIAMIHRVLAATLDVIVFLQNRQVTEIFYDPVFAKGKNLS